MFNFRVYVCLCMHALCVFYGEFNEWWIGLNMCLGNWCNRDVDTHDTSRRVWMRREHWWWSWNSCWSSSWILQGGISFCLSVLRLCYVVFAVSMFAYRVKFYGVLIVLEYVETWSGIIYKLNMVFLRNIYGTCRTYIVLQCAWLVLRRTFAYFMYGFSFFLFVF